MITTIFFYGCNTIAGTARGLGEDIKKTFGYIGKNNENKDSRNPGARGRWSLG